MERMGKCSKNQLALSYSSLFIPRRTHLQHWHYTLSFLLLLSICFFLFDFFLSLCLIFVFLLWFIHFMSIFEFLFFFLFSLIVSCFFHHTYIYFFLCFFYLFLLMNSSHRNLIISTWTTLEEVRDGRAV
jgi:hypothetical protein